MIPVLIYIIAVLVLIMERTWMEIVHHDVTFGCKENIDRASIIATGYEHKHPSGKITPQDWKLVHKNLTLFAYKSMARQLFTFIGILRNGLIVVFCVTCYIIFGVALSLVVYPWNDIPIPMGTVEVFQHTMDTFQICGLLWWGYCWFARFAITQFDLCT